MKQSELKADPAKVRDWNLRSRVKAAERARDVPRPGLKPGKRKSKAKIPPEIRAAAKRRSGGVCVHPGCKTKAIHVHHWLSEEHFPELAKIEANLSALCVKHHWAHHYEPDGRLPFSAIPDCTIRLAAKIGPRAQSHLDRYYMH